MRVWLVAVVVLSAASACGDSTSPPGVDAPPDVDAAPAAIDGVWHLTRTVTSQPSSPPGCHAMFGSTDTVVLDLEHEPHVQLPEDFGFDPSLYDPLVTADGARFAAEEFGLLSGESSTPVIIAHDLQLDHGQLTGTGISQGDGPDIGCTWPMSVVGTR